MAFELLPFDQTLTDAVEIIFLEAPETASGLPLGEEPLPLQFPPRITSDNKSADWTETFKGSWEPQAVWKGSTARKITLELTYIVDGKSFGTQEVALITKQCKGYFYRNIKSNIPIMKLKMYNHIGQELPGDFRLLDVTITHGDTIIDDGAGQFPLLTKISITGALTTQVGGEQKIDSLQQQPPIDWY